MIALAVDGAVKRRRVGAGVIAELRQLSEISKEKVALVNVRVFVRMVCPCCAACRQTASSGPRLSPTSAPFSVVLDFRLLRRLLGDLAHRFISLY